MNRREFIKRTFQLAGFAGLCSIGAGAVEEAIGFGVLPAVVGSSRENAPAFWLDWDGITENIGDTGTHVVLFENAANDGDETGVGGTLADGTPLAGANLVHTSTDINGALGVPPTRRSINAVEGMTWTSAAAEGYLVGGNNFTFVWKCKDISSVAESHICAFYDASTSDYIRIRQAVTGHLIFYVEAVGVTKLNATTAVAVPSTGDVWIVLWYDGAYIRGGFSTVKPTNWSDFSDGKGVSAAATLTCTEFDDRFDTLGHLAPGEKTPLADWYYFVASHSVLIAN